LVGFDAVIILRHRVRAAATGGDGGALYFLRRAHERSNDDLQSFLLAVGKDFKDH
jgi:hypothetical protein